MFFFLQESETKKLKRKRKTIGRPKYVINKMKINKYRNWNMEEFEGKRKIRNNSYIERNEIRTKKLSKIKEKKKKRIKM